MNARARAVTWGESTSRLALHPGDELCTIAEEAYTSAVDDYSSRLSCATVSLPYSSPSSLTSSRGGGCKDWRTYHAGRRSHRRNGRDGRVARGARGRGTVARQRRAAAQRDWTGEVVCEHRTRTAYIVAGRPSGRPALFHIVHGPEIYTWSKSAYSVPSDPIFLTLF